MAKSKTEITEDKLNKLSVAIDGKWDTDDFIIFLKSVEYIYNYHLFFIGFENHLLREKKIKSSSKSHLPSHVYGNSAIRFFLAPSVQDPLESSSIRDRHNIFHSYNIPLYPNLELKKIQYASPGSIDFIGIGEIFKTIKELIIHYIPNDRQKNETEILKLDIIQKEISILKQLGVDELEIKSIVLKKEVAIKQLTELRSENKITGVNIK